MTETPKLINPYREKILVEGGVTVTSRDWAVWEMCKDQIADFIERHYRDLHGAAISVALRWGDPGSWDRPE